MHRDEKLSQMSDKMRKLKDRILLSILASFAKFKLSLTMNPPNLVHQCVNRIFHLVRWNISQNGFKEALSNVEPYLSQLPRELQTLLINRAERQLDQLYTIRTLLTIWWSCIDNGDAKEVSTPRYLYNDEEGRKWILKKLGTLNNNEKVTKLSFLMYSFYSHLSVKIGHKQAEFLLEGSKINICGIILLILCILDDQLQDPRLMLSGLEQDLLGQVLSNFSNVSTLILPTIANSQLLEIASMTMWNLKILDISCSTNVTDFGLMSLVGSSSRCKQSLEQLFLDGTSSTTDGMFVLLANLPKLQVLESSLLERALDQVQNSLDLRKITVGRFWRANHILQNLPTVCPKLCQIIVLNVTPEQCRLLENFGKMANLRHVHIGQVNFSHFAQVLPNFGTQLTTLTYSNFAESVDFAKLIRSCPNLECLGLNCGSILETTELEMPENLSEVRLNIHAFIPKIIWTLLFGKCYNLIYIDMTPGIDLTDENLQSIMTCYRKALQNVRSFIVRGRHRGGDVNLTEKTVENLKSRSFELKCIGDCSTWAMQSHQEFLYI